VSFKILLATCTHKWSVFVIRTLPYTPSSYGSDWAVSWQNAVVAIIMLTEFIHNSRCCTPSPRDVSRVEHSWVAFGLPWPETPRHVYNADRVLLVFIKATAISLF